MNRILKAHISDLKRKMKARDREVNDLKEKAKKANRAHNKEMAPILAEIAKELCKHLEISYVKDYHLAAEIDIPNASLSRMKKGQYMFGEDTLAKLEAWAEKA